MLFWLHAVLGSVLTCHTLGMPCTLATRSTCIPSSHSCDIANLLVGRPCHILHSLNDWGVYIPPISFPNSLFVASIKLNYAFDLHALVISFLLTKESGQQALLFCLWRWSYLWCWSCLRRWSYLWRWSCLWRWSSLRLWSCIIHTFASSAFVGQVRNPDSSICVERPVCYVFFKR